MSLKQRTVSGLIWSFVDQFANQGITFVAGIILARILSPREFGLIGMITVFIAVSESFINSGFSSALIRKKNCSDVDYSTVFYFNLTVGSLLYVLLYLAAPSIAQFFEEPELNSIVRVLGLLLIIDSLTIIQRTILTKRIDFKLQTRISVIASIISGIISVGMAIYGWGVWSLVAQRLIKQSINSALLWWWNRWIPLAVFCRRSFKELFSFGSKLLVSGLIDTLYRNVYYLIIGKFFSAQELGFYTRADDFKRIPSENLNTIINRVSYPVLSEIQDDRTRLKTNYQKLIRSTMFITFILMLGMAAVAKPLVLALIGEKWEPSIVYLQLLCVIGMMYPLQALNLNMLQVSGRSDLFLRLEVIKKLLAVPIILLGIFVGVKAMLVGMIVNTFVAYYLNSFWSGRFVDYSFKQQLADLYPSFLLALTMGVLVLYIGSLIAYSAFIVLLIQLLVGLVFILVFCEMTRFRDYVFVKELIIEKIFKGKRK